MSEFFEYPLLGEVDFLLGLVNTKKIYTMGAPIEIDTWPCWDHVRAVLASWESKAEPRAIFAGMRAWVQLRNSHQVGTNALTFSKREYFEQTEIIAYYRGVPVVASATLFPFHLSVVGMDDDGWVMQEISVRGDEIPT
jgi:hypothetical protein